MSIRYFDARCDMQSVIELYQQCFAEAPWHERFDPLELEKEFTQFHDSSSTIFLVYTDKEKVIGAAIGFDVQKKLDVFELLNRVDQQSIYVAELFVDSSARQRGLCSDLLGTLLMIASASGFLRMSVRTSTAQTIIQRVFLDKFGCSVVARQSVVSTKWLNDQEIQVPDERIVMTGAIPRSFKNTATSSFYRPIPGMCCR